MGRMKTKIRDRRGFGWEPGAYVCAPPQEVSRQNAAAQQSQWKSGKLQVTDLPDVDI